MKFICFLLQAGSLLVYVDVYTCECTSGCLHECLYWIGAKYIAICSNDEFIVDFKKNIFHQLLVNEW